MTSDGDRPGIVITGSSGGIGAALAGHFCGMRRRVHGIDVAAAPAGLLDLAGYAHRQADIADEKALDAALAGIWSTGAVGAIIANAAVTDTAHRTAIDIPDAAWQDIIRVNVNGAFLTGRLAARRMRPQGFGNIVFITSSLAKLEFAQPNDAPYCTSKAAVEMFARVLALELAGTGVNVNTLFPSVKIDTGFFAHLAADARRGLEPPAILNEAVAALADLPPGTLSGRSIDHQRLMIDRRYQAELGLSLESA